MARQEQGESKRFSLKTGVKTGFAEYQDIGPVRSGGRDEIVCGSAADGKRLDPAPRFTDIMTIGKRKTLLEKVDERKQRRWLGKFPDTTGSDAGIFCIRNEGPDSAQAEHARKLGVDAVVPGIMGGVRAVDGDPAFDQVEHHPSIDTPADRFLVRSFDDPLHRMKRKRMMRNDHVDPLANRFLHDSRRHGQTAHHAPHDPFAVTDKQSDMIPFFRQSYRKKRIKVGNQLKKRNGHGKRSGGTKQGVPAITGE